MKTCRKRNHFSYVFSTPFSSELYQTRDAARRRWSEDQKSCATTFQRKALRRALIRCIFSRHQGYNGLLTLFFQSTGILLAKRFRSWF
jgi:hypothetical protein